LNVAVTVVSVLSVRMQEPVPLQPPPDQPANTEPDAAAAVSVMPVPCANCDAQVAPQLIPTGAEVTVPVPVPAGVTVNVDGGMVVNVAVTVVSASRATVHVLVPLHPPPDQPVNAELAEGAAVSVTLAPCANAAAHVAPQLMPAGAEVTVPLPEPAGATVNVAWGPASKVAVTVVFALSVSVQLAVPLHPPPDQPANTEPDAGAAESVTLDPVLNEAAHVEPQLMPAGDEVTVPVPVPLRDTVS
jgi:hypothetical protein